MGTRTSVSEIIASASHLDNRELESLVGQLNRLRAQRVAPALSGTETKLLKKINEGFPPEKWSRLVYLDDKMEDSALSEDEAAESLALAEELEAYTVERFGYLKKLAEIRGVSVEALMKELGLTPL
jgi:hypothetical protein